jgi:glucose/arabinose dehydrogenase/mono/diheme cytochrome c family protein
MATKKMSSATFGSWLLSMLVSVSGAHAAESSRASAGERLFNQQCSSCHNFRQDGIGPQLGGVSSLVSDEWLRRFIRSPQQMLEAGDERTKRLVEKYQVVMPSFDSLSGSELDELIAYLRAQQPPERLPATLHDREITNPIPNPVQFSGLVVDLKPFARIPSSSTDGNPPLARITKLDAAPHTSDPFVLDLRGKLYRLKKGKPLVYMDMAKLRRRFINQPGLATGFGSFAFHPDFARNGLLYTTHTESPGSTTADFRYSESIRVTVQWVLTEWKTKTPRSPSFSGKGRELLRADMVSGIHGVQEIAFNPHARRGNADYGLLYIGVGDGGSVENGYPFLPHSVERVWGTVLRIDPAGKNSSNGRYGIPPSNPFVNHENPKALKEIYAWGFRNPHRIAWSASGQMLVSNIGQAHIESLNLVEPGRDYGWPVREGSFLIDPKGDINKIYPQLGNDASERITYPVAVFDHDEGKAISGGYEYTGSAIPAMKGKFIFGDIPTGRLFYIDMKDVRQGSVAPVKEWKATLNGYPVSFAERHANERVDLHLGRDAAGELYILIKNDGSIYRLSGAGSTP